MPSETLKCREQIAYASQMLALLLTNPRETLSYTDKMGRPPGAECPVTVCNRVLREIRELIVDLEDKQGDTEEYEVDYTRLFVSAYPRPLCPPYESYYATGGKMLGRPDIVGDLKGILRSLGLKVRENQESLPDYIPTELELVSHIACLEQGMSSGLLEKMVYNHISVWLQEFSSCITRNAWTDYYRKLGNVIEGYGECITRLV